MPSISSSTSRSSLPFAFVKITSNAVPVINAPVSASVNRIFKSFSTDTKLTFTLLVSGTFSSLELSSSVSVSVIVSSVPESIASAIAKSPSSPTMPIFVKSSPTGAIASICPSRRFDPRNIFKITIAATTSTTPVQATIASKAVICVTVSFIHSTAFFPFCCRFAPNEAISLS